MEQAKLVARITELERQLADLKRQVDLLARPKDWRSVVGMFAGDEVMKRIDEAGRKIREKDRDRARKRSARKPTKATE